MFKVCVLPLLTDIKRGYGNKTDQEQKDINAKFGFTHQNLDEARGDR